MWRALGSTTDFVHALLMLAWVLGLPLLFASRWPRWRRAYAIYAVVFVVLSQGSQALLGECFLTTLARWFWEHPHVGPPPVGVDEWFTVRLARTVFRLSPPYRTITIISEVLATATAAGVLYYLHRERSSRRVRALKPEQDRKGADRRAT
jgi:hypothetical protein